MTCSGCPRICESLSLKASVTMYITSDWSSFTTQYLQPTIQYLAPTTPATNDTVPSTNNTVPATNDTVPSTNDNWHTSGSIEKQLTSACHSHCHSRVQTIINQLSSEFIRTQAIANVTLDYWTQIRSNWYDVNPELNAEEICSKVVQKFLP